MVDIFTVDTWVGQLARNTATNIHVGPFVDVGTGLPLTALTVGDITCKLVDANEVITALGLTAAGGDNDMTHVTGGVWLLELTADNLGTAGAFSISFRDDAVFRPVYVRGTVLGGGIMSVNVEQIGGSATLAEITGAADCPATPTPRQAIMLLYQWLRNDSQDTATERRILNDAGTEVLDATMSDDGTTFHQGKLGDA